MKKILTIAVLILITSYVKAQIETPVHWSYGMKKTGKADAIVFFKATIADGWHIYSQKKSDNGGPVRTSFTFTHATDYTLVGATTEPEPITRFEESFSMNVSFFDRTVIFQQKIKLKGIKAIVKGTLEYMTCNDEKCLPPEQVPFIITVK